MPERFDLATPEERERAAAAVDKLRSVSPEWLHDRIKDQLPMFDSVSIVYALTVYAPGKVSREAARVWSFTEIEAVPPTVLRRAVETWLETVTQELAKWLMQGGPEADA